MKRITQMTLAVAMSCAIAAPVIADETAFDVEAISCFDVISLPEEDSLFVTAILIGYMNGKSGASETSATDIQSKVESFDATCGENPDMLAIEALS